MKMTAFWDIAPCSLGAVDRCFEGVCCLHHQSYFNNSTVHYIPEGCHLTRDRENLKSHIHLNVLSSVEVTEFGIFQ
jgi:hypothetical protein